MKTDEEYMQLALELAASAKGKTNPNPVVGAVIVKNSVIVGSGLHRKAGEPHAEVHAFNMAGGHAKGATLYVTLEPCSHFGKTPPCANLVKESGVSRVVVAAEDPNPEVAGRGIRLLREAGIDVKVGVLEAEAKKLNERFIHNMMTNRPFVISKFAMTLDGKLAAHTGHSQWISGEKSRGEVHLLRNETDAILVGIGTVLADDPSLTTRLPNGGGKNPIRIILDSRLRLPLTAKVCDTKEARTIVITTEGADKTKVTALKDKGVECLSVSRTESGVNLEEMLIELYRLGITDILVEGGGEVNASLLRAGLINKYIVFIAPKLLGGRDSLSPFTGTNVNRMDEALNVTIDEIDFTGEDIRVIAYPKSGEHDDL